ncbi:MAG: hypothetical protein HGJ94_08975 [Desulfosarcina sp.]|nr:hypothetical protein [Desulfosarcina sp.]MBC2744507.1 hypothetical protein [Desulfosarcina sp.]MBC2767417.1 hypothetical protein [Desulfosarcina sp.]
MKKMTMIVAIVVVALVGFNSASAEMVNIGLGQMEQSEFVALKAMVQGGQTDTVPALSTPLDRPERYGMVEMARADFEALRDKVAGRSVSVDEKPAVKAVQMVNIGTGEMPMDEFVALKRMVEGTGVFKFDCLAAVQP